MRLQSSTFIIVLLICAGTVLFAQPANAGCKNLAADANAISAKAKDVQSYEGSSNDYSAKVSWNTINHYALEGAQEFKSCDDSAPRLLYSVSFADATAVGMHYGFLPWSEGAGDIGGTLQIIESLPHTPTVAREWDLVDRLYLQVCSMHGASCTRRTY